MANMDVVKEVAEELKENDLNTLNVQEQPSGELRALKAHVELPGLRHETKDVLKQLEMNIQLLEDLGGRLGYVMSEVRTLIRR